MNFKQLIAILITVVVVICITRNVLHIPEYWVGYITGTAAMVVARIFEN